MMRMQLLWKILLLSLCLQNQRTSALKATGKCVKLDMAKNSAAYVFTQDDITDQAAIDYIRKEWQDRRDFLEVWELANRSLGQNCIMPPGLRREHLMAINAYTQESRLYEEFNEATRKYGASDAIYQTNFHFKGFHYLLSIALAKFQQKQRITFRGVRIVFNATKGEEVRLGQFSSTSLMRSIAISFMNSRSDANTLFEIRTRLGVLIREFSDMEHEEEVMIPPTEVFEVEDTPQWEKKGSKKWIKIKLVSRRSKGIRVTVDTCNGAFKVKRRNINCSKLGQLLRGIEPSCISN
ncbi:NAD(P)(+)--arginine ADP-ribosyltransferase 1-like [Chiloscyllium punctatum]|uniref:NAD(P)(+)--arginine ADP-ribosyltransferase n=1 Tax=Chiloscyllium punctatum TaxID=137246 RepID=A0A401SXZ6_CHIPU|nr:hypothetical protein [Chiloscyllium punctatum]